MFIRTIFNRFFSASACLYFFLFLTLISGVTYIFHKTDLMPIGYGVTLSTDLQTIIQHFGVHDIASYAKGAVVLRDQDLQTYAAHELFQNWPPGMSSIENFIFSIKEKAPIPFSLLIFTLVMWAFVLSFLAKTLTNYLSFSPLLAFIVTGCIVFTPFFHNELLWNLVLLSESLSTPFFILGFISTFYLFLDNRFLTKHHIIFTALMFTIATYIRAQFDILFLTFLILFGVLKLSAPIFNRKDNPIYQIFPKKITKSLLFIAVLYISLTTPYRILIKSPFMVLNNYLWPVIWHDRTFFEHKPAEFIFSGGGCVLCETAPKTCATFMAREKAGNGPGVREARLAAITTVLKNPVSFVSAKIPYFYKNWGTDFFSNLMLTLMCFILPAFLIFSVRVNQWKYFCLYIFALTGIIFGSLGFSIFIHVEPRYMLPIKLFVFWSQACFIGYIVHKVFAWLTKYFWSLNKNFKSN